MHGLPKRYRKNKLRNKIRNKQIKNWGGSRDAEKKLGFEERGGELTVGDREADDESVRMRLLRQKAKRDRQRKPQAQGWSTFKRTLCRLDGLFGCCFSASQ